MLNSDTSTMLNRRRQILPSMAADNQRNGIAGLGSRIRDRRGELRLTGEQLAKKARCTKSAVSQWESGDTKNLKLENFFAVADALEVEPRWLASGKGQKFTHRKRDEMLEAILTIYDSVGPEGKKTVLAGAMTAKSLDDARRSTESGAAQRA